jgi:type I restriction enzyme S subunit
MLPAGTVVVSRDATIGRCGILGVPMATSQHFANWVCGSALEPRYLWLVFRTAMQQHFNSMTDGATLRTIGMPDMRNLVVPIPPLEEQRTIVERAADIGEEEKDVLVEVRRQLDLLTEHRQALITAGVTEGLNGVQRVA